MTNMQIITNTAIAAGLYTEEEVEAIFAEGRTLPLHTFKKWQELGYQVRRGEKAALTCEIWRMKHSKEKLPMQDGNDVEIDESSFFKHKAFFFTAAQVDRIAKA